MSLDLLAKIEKLNEVGIALSAQRNISQLLETILISAKELTIADGGTLYLVDADKKLIFDVVHNDTLDIHLGGIHKEKIPFKPIPIFLNNKEENLTTVASFVANRGETVNITDIYSDQQFDFSGALAFDKNTGYRTQSMLAIPLKNADHECIGVLQLINSFDAEGNITSFSKESESLARSLASQASVALSNQKLIDEHKVLFESFSKLIADTIDKKSPYTGAHCKRVPVLTMMIAHKAAEMKAGVFADFEMSENDFFELETAAWLHDCGKLTTPEHVMDKRNKLETIFDRIELLKTRLNLKAYEDIVKHYNIPSEAVIKSREIYRDNFTRLQKINSGGEFLSDEDADFIQQLSGNYYYNLDNKSIPLLSSDEVENLSIQRGTLNERERQIIQDHAAMSIYMLDLLPFPKELQRVSEYAGGHHERMDGKGYPNGLTREQLSIPARMMGLADIFEALSAGDRPYKESKTLSESLKILGFMKKDGHIDPDIFNLFIEEKVYLDYALKHLEPSQLDEVIHANIPGYTGNK